MRFLTLQSENTRNRIREVKGQWEQASMDVDCLWWEDETKDLGVALEVCLGHQHCLTN